MIKNLSTLNQRIDWAPINERFLDILCRFEASTQTLDLTDEQRAQFIEIHRQLFDEAIERLNRERLKE